MNTNFRQKQLLKATEDYIKAYFENEGSGHDWWHIYRVKKVALQIAKTEGGDIFHIELAALLHDLDDWKLNGGSKVSKTFEWLSKMDVSEQDIEKVLEIIHEVSYKGAGVPTPASSLEAKIVQDADRLDAIGAIGIARTFAYGGNKNRLIYNPAVQPENHDSFEAYKKTNAPTINHFYEKLLLLKDRMNTQTAKELAEKRHQFMEDFLEQFFNEWEANF
ncbi:HD domain-containing protein [Maribellus sediminis]|uniref:HD domain-containing protein n=1 Tax=Maribellus sediminis TaxID=2696285 RepID=UPI00142F6C87|nr:HD domain-containing protein [Maribellus sediminis]